MSTPPADQTDRSIVALRRVRELVCAAASTFDAEQLSGEGAAHALAEWATIVNAAQTGVALTAARIETCGPPASSGANSALDFVAKTTGTTSTKARDTVVHGRRIAIAPKTRAAATGGRLSPEQAVAITDATAVNPDAEDDLLHEATSVPVGELRRRCAQKKVEQQDRDAIDAQIHLRRCLRRYRDAEGAEHLHATGTAREMAKIDQALAPLIEEQFVSARRTGDRASREAYSFDALVALSERAVADDRRPGTGVRRRDPIRHLMLVRVDMTALLRGRVGPGETCEIAGLGPIPVAAARDMLGESVLKLVLTRGVDVRTVTHLGRGPSAAQKLALLWEQPVCRRQGCGRRARLEYDHATGFEYRKTRHTRIDELDLLCEPDHDLKSRAGWSLVAGTGIRPMVPPGDPRHPARASDRGP